MSCPLNLLKDDVRAQAQTIPAESEEVEVGSVNLQIRKRKPQAHRRLEENRAWTRAHAHTLTHAEG
eukprot:2648302-Pleurochrysis_carterae.AAC.1